MKLSTIILSSIIALVPLNVLAQNDWSRFPQWVKNRTKSIESTEIYNSGPFLFLVDKNYIPLGSGIYGITLFQVGNTVSEPRFYKQSFYEFNCITTKYTFKGWVSGTIRDGELRIESLLDECGTLITCQDYTHLDSDLIQGIKRFCPSR